MKNLNLQITLYAIPVSTSCARTRIVLDHKGLSYKELPPPDGYATQAYKSLVPAGTVPGLIVEGLPAEHFPNTDLVLSDTGAQCLLLEELVPEPQMMLPPTLATLQKRTELTMLAAFHDTRLEPSVRALFPLVKPAHSRDQAAAETAIALFQQRAHLLDELCNPQPFLGGALFTHVDAAFPTSLYMGMDIAKRMGHEIELSPKLTTWLEALASLKAVQKNLVLNRQAVSGWLDSKLNQS